MTLVAGNHLTVRRARPLARLADLLLLNRKPQVPTCVEVAQRNSDAELHIRSASVACCMPEVSAAAEESREEVEGVVCGSSGCTALSVLFYAFMAVLVVDLPGG